MSADPVEFIMRRSGHMGWTQADERAFIAGLGRWGTYTLTRPPNRAELLRGYLEGLDKRQVWRGLDSADLRAFAEEQLREEASVALD